MVVKTKYHLTIANFPEGEYVRLRGKKRMASVVRHMDQEQYPGGVQVTPALGGFRFWNIEDLEVIPSRKLR